MARGMVQALQEKGLHLWLTMFCERRGWHDLEGLVCKFQNRVSFGVRAEIVELTTIPYIKGSRARALYKAGLRTPLAIAEASIPEIVKALFESSSWNEQEGSAQRRIQVGVAKKIKNGAHKIVLEKAEEARVASFKALGLDVPQFSGPVFLTGGGSPSMQGEGNSSGDNSTSSFPNVERSTEYAAKASLEGRVHSERAAEVKSTGVMQIKSSPDNSQVHLRGLDYLTAAMDQTKSTDLTDRVELQSLIDRTRASDDSLALEKQKRCKRENLSSSYKSNACGKGPIHAVKTLGGFDSFLDLWGSI
ncbi:hypothetical protein ACFX2C_016979 [Malus domestica]